MLEIPSLVDPKNIPIIIFGIVIGLRGKDRVGTMLLYTMNTISLIGWSVFFLKKSLESFTTPSYSSSFHRDAIHNMRTAQVFFISCTQNNAFVLMAYSVVTRFRLENSELKLHLVKSTMSINVLFYIMNPNGLVVLRIMFQALLIYLYKTDYGSQGFLEVFKNIAKDVWSGIWNVLCIILLLFMPLVQGCYVDNFNYSSPF